MKARSFAMLALIPALVAQAPGDSSGRPRGARAVIDGVEVVCFRTSDATWSCERAEDRAGSCNSYGCWERGGGCNSYGCWRDGGGCNSYGCWHSPLGSCNSYGCADEGSCNSYGCPKPRRSRGL